jgi:MFS family permease
VPKTLALTVLCTGMLMIILDVTIVNVALPAIQHDLGFSQSGLAWVINAYLIPFGSLLLLAGRIGDLVSRRGVFIGGLILFTVASAACGLAGKQQVDLAGAALITGALMTTVYTIVNPGGAARTASLAALAAALMIGFVVREATAAAPLIPLRVFRSRSLSGANVAQLLSAAGVFGTFFVGVLYVQHVLGYDALRIGLAFLPVTVVMGGVSLRYTDRLIARFGARRLVITGLALVAAGLALFARVPVDGRYLADVLPSVLLLGLGGGLAFPALAAVAMGDATPEDAGLASGVFNTTAQAGSALGLAVLAALASGRYGSLRAAGVPDVLAQTGGYRLAFLTASALVVAAIAVVVAALRSPVDSREPVAV